MMHRTIMAAAGLTLILLALPLWNMPEHPARFPFGSQEQREDLPDSQEEIQEPQQEPASTPENHPEEAVQEESQEEPAPEQKPALSSTIRVKLPDGQVEELDMEEYLWGVVAAEMPAAFEPEALKAQAVAARTYTAYQMSHPKDHHPDADVCTDFGCCQAWISKEDRLEKWPEDQRENYTAKIAAAVADTAGETLCFQDQPALTVFHASSDGHTRSAQAVWGQDIPYLVSVDSPEGEKDAPNYYSVVTMTPEEFQQQFSPAHPEAKLGDSPENWFGTVEQDENGETACMTVGGVRVTAQELRSICGLRSASFQVEYQEGTFTFYVTGYGHGVGMSQYGANVMAKGGSTYQEILNHYYPGTALENNTGRG